jgi:hypothetical protein
MSTALSLPDLDALDHAALKALLLSHHEQYTATLTSRTSEIERLLLLVEKLQRMLFGTKSEKVLRKRVVRTVAGCVDRMSVCRS